MDRHKPSEILQMDSRIKDWRDKYAAIGSIKK